jgi:hypothetical protein
MKSDEKGEILQESLSPLSSFLHNALLNPSVANNKQMVLAKNLHRSYQVPEGNILRLIIYADIVLNRTRGKERNLFFSDLSAIADSGKNKTVFEKVVFKGREKSFEISSPYLIDKLYNSLLAIIDFRNTGKKDFSVKKPASSASIKKLATELYSELTEKEKITGSKPLYIIGYIFSLYNVGLKKGEPILTEKEFKVRVDKMKPEGETNAENYLQYLSRRIRPYINWKSVNALKQAFPLCRH